MAAAIGSGVIAEGAGDAADVMVVAEAADAADADVTDGAAAAMVEDLAAAGTKMQSGVSTQHSALSIQHSAFSQGQCVPLAYSQRLTISPLPDWQGKEVMS